MSRRVLTFLGFIAVGTWSYWTVLVEMFKTWGSNPDYSHGYLVLPLACFFLWLRQEDRPDVRSAGNWYGLAAILIAALVRLGAARFYIPEFDAYTIPIWVFGLVWVVFGWPIARWALPAIAFVFFAAPLPGQVELMLSQPLQKLSANVSGFMFRVLGQPAVVEGTTILLGEHWLEVARACSGLRMFYSIIAVAAALAIVMKPPRWLTLSLFVLIAPIAVTVNVARVLATGFLKMYLPEEAFDTGHDVAGFLMIPMGLTLFMLVRGFLLKLVQEYDKGIHVAARWLAVRLGAIAAVCVVVVLWEYTRRDAVYETMATAALRFEEEKQWGDAMLQWDNYLAAFPDDVTAKEHLAQILAEHSADTVFLIRAADLYHALWEGDRSRIGDLKKAIEIAVRLRNYKRAVSWCDELAQHGSGDDRQSALRTKSSAILLYLENEAGGTQYTWRDARAALQAAVESQPIDLPCAGRLLDVYLNHSADLSVEDRGKACVELVDRLIAERSEEGLAWLLASQFYTGSPQRDQGRADQYFEKALECASSEGGSAAAEVYLAAARRAIARRDLDQARVLLRQAATASPTDYRAYVALAELQQRGGDREAAIATLKEARSAVSSLELALILPLATLLAQQGRLDEAEAEVKPLETKVASLGQKDQKVVKVAIATMRSRIVASREGPLAAIAVLEPTLRAAGEVHSPEYATSMLRHGWSTLASFYEQAGLLDQAVGSIDMAKRFSPQDLSAELARGFAAMNAGDLTLARQTFQQIVSSQPGVAPAWLGLARATLRQESDGEEGSQIQAAVEQFVNKATLAGADEADVQLVRIELAIHRKDWNQAAAMLEKASQGSPEDARFLRLLALVYRESGQPDKATEAVKQWAKLEPHSLPAASVETQWLLASGEVDQAIEKMLAWSEDRSDPERSQAMMTLAKLLQSSGEQDRAVQLLDDYLQRRPDDLRVQLERGALAVRDGDDAKAQAIEQLLRDSGVAPNWMWQSLRVHRLLAQSPTIQSPIFREVIGLVDALREARPRWPWVHFLQGQIQNQLGRTQLAVEHYMKAWELGYRSVELSGQLIESLGQLGRTVDAKRYAISSQPYFDSVPELFDLAIPYFADGDRTTKMLEIAEAWVRRRPDDAQSHVRLARTLAAVAEVSDAETKRDYLKRAEAEFKKALELQPSDPSPWVAAIHFYSQQLGSLEKAIAVAEEFAQVAELNALDKSFLLAQFYDRLGIADRSRNAYQDSVRQVDSVEDKRVKSAVLTAAARFFVNREAPLSELYARQAYALDPENKQAALLLAQCLAPRVDEPSVRSEAIAILDRLGDADGYAASLLTYYLSRSTETSQRQRAQQLLDNKLSLSRLERLSLARVYAAEARLERVLAITEEMLLEKEPSRDELVFILEFWKEHFAEKGQFQNLANQAYQRMVELPNGALASLEMRIKLESSEKVDPQRIVVEALKQYIQQTGSATSRPALMVVLASPAAEVACDYSLADLFQVSRLEYAQQLAGAAIFARAPAEILRQVADLVEGELRGPNAATVHKQLFGDLVFLSGDAGKAVEVYKDVLKEAPQNISAINNQVLALASAVGPEQALQLVGSALQQHPTAATLVDTQIWLLAKLNRLDEAQDALNKHSADLEKADAPLYHLRQAQIADLCSRSDDARRSLLDAMAHGVTRAILSPADAQEWDRLRAKYLDTDS